MIKRVLNNIKIKIKMPQKAYDFFFIFGYLKIIKIILTQKV